MDIFKGGIERIESFPAKELRALLMFIKTFRMWNSTIHLSARLGRMLRQLEGLLLVDCLPYWDRSNTLWLISWKLRVTPPHSCTGCFTGFASVRNNKLPLSQWLLLADLRHPNTANRPNWASVSHPTRAACTSFISTHQSRLKPTPNHQGKNFNRVANSWPGSATLSQGHPHVT